MKESNIESQQREISQKSSDDIEYEIALTKELLDRQRKKEDRYGNMRNLPSVLLARADLLMTVDKRGVVVNKCRDGRETGRDVTSIEDMMRVVDRYCKEGGVIIVHHIDET
jgi:hypothetical protein